MTENDPNADQSQDQTTEPAPDRAEEKKVDVPQNETPVDSSPVSSDPTPTSDNAGEGQKAATEGDFSDQQ